MPGKFERYWEMRGGGPYDPGEEMFKCMDCGAESFPEDGWNGEPDPDRCAGHCSSRSSDWSPGRVSDKYRNNHERIFPSAPGAGI
ncbi:MAG: hypothetical protein KKB20_10710 [Proteobacteria bacterium]|nr:hypothetical protein [Pseudomonadota bacterium]